MEPLVINQINIKEFSFVSFCLYVCMFIYMMSDDGIVKTTANNHSRHHHHHPNDTAKA